MRYTILLLFALARATALQAENLAPSATELFESHFAAIGLNSAGTIHACVIEGSVSHEGQRSEFTLRVQDPAKLLMTLHSPAGDITTIARDSNGRYWQKSRRGVQDVDHVKAAEISSLVIGVFPPAQLLISQRLEDAICEHDQAEGRPVMAVGKKRVPHRRFPRLLFDVESGLLMRVAHSRLSEYRTVEGMKIPFRIQQGVKEIYEIKKVKFKAELEEAIFERPGRGGGWLSDLTPNVMRPAHRESTLLSRPGRLEIVRRPAPAPAAVRVIARLPEFDASSGRHSQVDLRATDLRKLDLSDGINDLLHADFSTRTLWPQKLPAGVNPGRIMQGSQNPGLGVRKLHASGITGKGVGVGIIDFPLLAEHEEYAERLRLYEEIQSPAGIPAHMHGCAVASLAVGQRCGVAPGADLYYVASLALTSLGGKAELDYRPIAKGIHRLLDINTTLPVDQRIRVISISMGWSEGQRGFDEAMQAVERGKRENVFVISTVLRKSHGLRFDGLGRPALSDPEVAESFTPGSWWAEMFWNGEMRFKPGKRLCVPMDCRGTASPTGPKDYAHYGNGGWSWAVPWVAGLYALACQVDPEITPERFWSEALRTGTTIQTQHQGEKAELGTIANPERLLKRLTPPSAGTRQGLE